MQRIYSDGKTGLGEAVPDEWEKPAITINYRCPKRIVKLINKIRSGADDHIQKPADDAPEGFVRLFLVQDDDIINKTTVETEIAKKMAENTSDDQWSRDNQETKLLLAYGLMPHKIMELKDTKKNELDHYIFENNPCYTRFYWKWGSPRGGTPAKLICYEYLDFSQLFVNTLSF